MSAKKYIPYFSYKDKDGHIRDGYSIEIVDVNQFFNGKLLKEALESRNMTTWQFANMVSKHPIQIERYINGGALPPLDVFRKICVLLKLDPIDAINAKIVEVRNMP